MTEPIEANIVPVDTSTELAGIERLADHFLASGYFKDLRSRSQAVVKILKGRELGIGPFTAVDQINMINGKPSPNANLLAALIRKSKDYDYQILEHTNSVCIIQILRHRKPSGKPVEFSIEDARKAGLTRNATYNAYPKNMLFARCISNASKFETPDITTGLYVPEDFEDVTPDFGNQIPSKPSAATSDLIKLVMETGVSLEDINTYLGTEIKTWEEISTDSKTLSQVMNYLETKKDLQ